ncbi:MAG: Fe(2+) transporter permease subunit FeoB [Spirochaetia bacterium]|jgi:ferrous iron transport protein B|nr:Fe(2+) transporter permease subunit FeoB [Spirochaetia bacterium]
MSGKKIIAVAGNPNCGKTTLFNSLTNGHVKTGNWPGVTVEKLEGVISYPEEKVTLVDLPGIYSFYAASEDEKAAREYILSGEAQFIVNIVDANNLERNLYLTTQLIEMGVPVFVVVNMVDIAAKNGIRIDTEKLSKKMGVPVEAISAVNKNDVEQVKKSILDYFSSSTPTNHVVEYPNEIEDVINDWQKKIKNVQKESARWSAIKILENDKLIIQEVTDKTDLTKKEISEKKENLKKILGDSPDIVIADYRYGYIKGILGDIVKRSDVKIKVTEVIDSIVLNRFLGIPVFLFALYMVFWLTNIVGGAFIDFFDILFGTIFVDGVAYLLGSAGSPAWIISIIAGGVGAGIQTVATFVPIVFMMFLCLSILEVSGYMARAAFVMDRLMRAIGLPGKAFIPMLVGFGCTVPAIMGTRTIENKRDRLMTLFMAPFMSCGARLPVYALFAAVFFPDSRGIMVFLLYLSGIILAVLTGLMLKNTLFKGEASYFIMELPPYHAPKFNHIMIHTWMRLKHFMIRAGKVIIIAVLVLAFLNSFGLDGSFGNENSDNSVLTKIGKTLSPVFQPMGVEEENWPAVVGLFTGLFAKEAVVGTLDALYSQIEASSAEDVSGKGNDDEDSFDFFGGVKEAFASIPEALAGTGGGLSDPLGTSLIKETDSDALAEEIGSTPATFGVMGKYFTEGPLQVFAYLLFVLIYFPCLAAFGALIKEAGKFYGILITSYLTFLAWIVATLFYQITLGRSFFWIAVGILFLVLTVLFFKILGRNEKLVKKMG